MNDLNAELFAEVEVSLHLLNTTQLNNKIPAAFAGSLAVISVLPGKPFSILRHDLTLAMLWLPNLAPQQCWLLSQRRSF